MTDPTSDRHVRRWQPVRSGGSGAAAPSAGRTRSTRSARPAAKPANGQSTRQLRLTAESIAWIALLIITLLTRLWDLSSKSLHHDESLHAYYSWLFAVGSGYVHDPLMHGPVLFHSNAFAYLLFGDNDLTSRIWPAVLGIVLVLMPLLLRGPQLLGRWGALACGALLAFSPTLLYQARYIRHDPWVLVLTFATAIAALRYLERPERRWMVTIGVSAGLLFATMEVSFIIAFVFVSFIGTVTLWQTSRRALFLSIATLATIGVAWKLMPALGAPSMPEIPWEHPTGTNVSAFTQDLLTHPFVLASVGLLLLGIVLVLGALDRVRDRHAANWVDGVLTHVPPGSTADTLRNVNLDRRSLGIAVGAGLTLYAAFYASMYTNMFGLASGTFGALGYWLGQHDVQRGDQPWFYYLLLLPQYEFIAVVIAPIGFLLTARHVLPRIRRSEPIGRRWFLRAFGLYWAGINIAVFSWAGEKMPWLTVHMALPLIIVAASFIGELAEYLEREIAGEQRWRVWGVASSVLVLGASSFLLWSWGTAGQWQPRDEFVQRSMRTVVSDNPWIMYLPFIAAVGFAALTIWRLGRRVALPALAVGGIVLTLFGQMHVTWRMTQQEADVPKDMLIYVQSSPDVARVVEEIGQLSTQLTGGKDLGIAYDSGTSWPMQWYLRDYTKRRFFGSSLVNTPEEPLVLISDDNMTRENLDLLSGYTYVQYPMRWWFPEDETYRRFAIAPELNKTERQNYQPNEPCYSSADPANPTATGDTVVPCTYGIVDVAESVWNSVWGLHEPQQQAKMFRMLMFRELPSTLGSFNFRLYVRNDLLPLWNELRY